MVIDEAHRLKNPTSRLFEHLCSIPHQHCLLLTGTPLQNKTEVSIDISALLYYMCLSYWYPFLFCLHFTFYSSLLFLFSPPLSLTFLYPPYSIPHSLYPSSPSSICMSSSLLTSLFRSLSHLTTLSHTYSTWPHPILVSQPSSHYITLHPVLSLCHDDVGTMGPITLCG